LILDFGSILKFDIEICIWYCTWKSSKYL